MGHSKKINPRRKQSESMSSQVMELIRSASHGDLDEILLLESEGVDPNIGDYDGRTPLHLAASEGQLEVVEHLIEKKVDLLPKDRWGNTPLDDANKTKHTAIVKLLEQAIKLNTTPSRKEGKAKQELDVELVTN
jgi:glutaminase